MRLSLGIVQSAYAATTPYTLDPINYESDWTALSIPTGWVADLVAPNAEGTYSANGTHVAVGEFQYLATRTITPRPIAAYTHIVCWEVNGATAEDASSRTVNSLFDPPSHPDEHYIVIGDDYISGRKVFENNAQWITRDNQIRHVWAPGSASLMLRATTLEQDGTYTSYLLTAEGHVQKTQTTYTPLSGLVDQIESFSINLATGSAGAESDLKIHHTYIGIDEELTEAQIKTIATGWGWTESAYSSGAAEQTNANWTASALPATWNETANTAWYPGTPAYVASGAYSNSSTDEVAWYQDTAKEYTNAVTLILHANSSADPVEIGLFLEVAVRNTGSIACYIFGNGTSAWEIGYSVPSPGVAPTLTPGVTTGDFFTAITIDLTTKNVVGYLIQSGQATQSTAYTAPLAPNFVVAKAAMRMSGTPTPGTVKAKHTYVGFDEVLNQTAIESVCSGWGWTP